MAKTSKNAKKSNTEMEQTNEQEKQSQETTQPEDCKPPDQEKVHKKEEDRVQFKDLVSSIFKSLGPEPPEGSDKGRNEIICR